MQRLAIALALALVAFSAQAYTVSPAVPTNGLYMATSPNPEFFSACGVMSSLFVTDDGAHGREVFSYNGYDISLLMDVREGPLGSRVSGIFPFWTQNQGAVFFADDGNGPAAYVTDCSTAGTRKLPLHESASQLALPYDYTPEVLVAYNGIYFAVVFDTNVSIFFANSTAVYRSKDMGNAGWFRGLSDGAYCGTSIYFTNENSLLEMETANVVNSNITRKVGIMSNAGKYYCLSNSHVGFAYYTSQYGHEWATLRMSDGVITVMDVNVGNANGVFSRDASQSCGPRVFFLSTVNSHMWFFDKSGVAVDTGMDIPWTWTFPRPQNEAFGIGCDLGHWTLYSICGTASNRSICKWDYFGDVKPTVIYTFPQNVYLIQKADINYYTNILMQVSLPNGQAAVQVLADDRTTNITTLHTIKTYTRNGCGITYENKGWFRTPTEYFGYFISSREEGNAIFYGKIGSFNLVDTLLPSAAYYEDARILRNLDRAAIFMCPPTIDGSNWFLSDGTTTGTYRLSPDNWEEGFTTLLQANGRLFTWVSSEIMSYPYPTSQSSYPTPTVLPIDNGVFADSFEPTPTCSEFLVINNGSEVWITGGTVATSKLAYSTNGTRVLESLLVSCNPARQHAYVFGAIPDSLLVLSADGVVATIDLGLGVQDVAFMYPHNTGMLIWYRNNYYSTPGLWYAEYTSPMSTRLVDSTLGDFNDGVGNIATQIDETQTAILAVWPNAGLEPAILNGDNELSIIDLVPGTNSSYPTYIKADAFGGVAFLAQLPTGGIYWSNAPYTVQSTTLRQEFPNMDYFGDAGYTVPTGGIVYSVNSWFNHSFESQFWWFKNTQTILLDVVKPTAGLAIDHVNYLTSLNRIFVVFRYNDLNYNSKVYIASANFPADWIPTPPTAAPIDAPSASPSTSGNPPTSPPTKSPTAPSAGQPVPAVPETNSAPPGSALDLTTTGLLVLLVTVLASWSL